MTLTVGNKVIYPSQGPCRIDHIVKRVIDGNPINFYHLVVLAEDGGELYVPVDKAQGIGIRLLLDKSEIPNLLAQLKRTASVADNWKQRAVYNLKLFTSGSAFDLAEIIESLTELRDTKALTLGEARTLERARSLLICEISEVMGETEQEARQQVDIALTARKKEVGPGLVIKRSLVKETATQVNRKAQQSI